VLIAFLLILSGTCVLLGLLLRKQQADLSNLLCSVAAVTMGLSFLLFRNLIGVLLVVVAIERLVRVYKSSNQDADDFPQGF
jgi:hypothetical protein